MRKAATPGFCPYCQTPLNPGATACTGCSAFQTTRWDDLGIYRTSLRVLYVLGALFLPIILIFFSPIAALIVFIAFIVGYFFHVSRWKRQIVWVVGGRRGLA